MESSLAEEKRRAMDEKRKIMVKIPLSRLTPRTHRFLAKLRDERIVRELCNAPRLMEYRLWQLCSLGGNVFVLRTCLCTPENVQFMVPDNVIEERVETRTRYTIDEMRRKILEFAGLIPVERFLLREDSIDVQTSENRRSLRTSFVKLIK